MSLLGTPFDPTREAASPDIMDGDVTDVVEDAVAGVEGVDYIMSQSLEGTSICTVRAG